MFCRRFQTSLAIVSILAIPGITLAAAKEKAEKAEKAKTEKKPAATSSKGAGQLLKTFKQWDKNKDSSVDKDELEKFYARLKAKPKKKGDAAAAGEPDPMAPVHALLAKTDTDSDGKISQSEFDEWAGKFSEFATKVAALQADRVRVEREMANLQGLLARSGRVTAADGIFEQEARRGLITYKQSLEQIDGELKALDAEGHGDYAELFLPRAR